MMLFNEQGDVYLVTVSNDHFFEMLTPDTFKILYSVNFYHFFIETTNRFHNDIKCDSKIKCLEDEYYNGIKESIYNFRNSVFYDEKEVLEIETQCIIKIAKEITGYTPFSPN